MNILGIDTSSLATSVAVIEDNKLICEYTVNTKKTLGKLIKCKYENDIIINILELNKRKFWQLHKVKISFNFYMKNGGKCRLSKKN